MNNKIILIMVCALLLPLVSSYYAGETIIVEHDLGTDKLIYTIIENTTNITEPIVTFNSTHINITFPSNMPPQTYKIIFLEETTNEVIVEVPVYSSGGGSSRTKYVDREVIKEVPNYITQYEENQTISLVDQLIPTEATEKINWIITILCIVGLIVIIYGLTQFLKNLNSNENIELEGGEEEYE